MAVTTASNTLGDEHSSSPSITMTLKVLPWGWIQLLIGCAMRFSNCSIGFVEHARSRSLSMSCRMLAMIGGEEAAKFLAMVGRIRDGSLASSEILEQKKLPPSRWLFA